MGEGRKNLGDVGTRWKSGIDIIKSGMEKKNGLEHGLQGGRKGRRLLYRRKKDDIIFPLTGGIV